MQLQCNWKKSLQFFTYVQTCMFYLISTETLCRLLSMSGKWAALCVYTLNVPGYERLDRYLWLSYLKFFKTS